MKVQTPRGAVSSNNGAPSAHIPRPDSIAFTAAKHAVVGPARPLSLDGRQYDITCGQIDVGNVTRAGRAQTTAKQANGTFVIEPTMDVRHAADTVVAMANLPLTVNIQSVTVIPSAMPYIGRG